MDESDDPGVYDGRSENAYSDDTWSIGSEKSYDSADCEEPNFDEEDIDQSRSIGPNFEEPAVDRLAIDDHTRVPSHEPFTNDETNNFVTSEEAQSQANDTANKEVHYEEGMEPLSPELSHSNDLDGAYEFVLMDKHRWPRIYRLPSELQHPLSKNKYQTVHLKLSLF
ncbi:MAG: hypothetical protein Q9166_002656 [cf. Caloplaca sp. 2 TL-2023]